MHHCDNVFIEKPLTADGETLPPTTPPIGAASKRLSSLRRLLSLYSIFSFIATIIYLTIKNGKRQSGERTSSGFDNDFHARGGRRLVSTVYISRLSETSDWHVPAGGWTGCDGERRKKGTHPMVRSTKRGIHGRRLEFKKIDMSRSKFRGRVASASARHLGPRETQTREFFLMKYIFIFIFSFF